MNILVVDDEKLLVKGLKASLQNEGFKVFTAYDGIEALDLIRKERLDLIILDIMLPQIDGITLCKKIRESMDVPIIMLTAKDDYADMVLGLEMGADDYITKPFHTRVLIARINSVLRRINKPKNSADIIEFENLKINFKERTLYKSGQEINLTAKEFDIVKVLLENRGIVLSREKIFDLVWHELECDTRTVDVHISKLREKLEDDPTCPSFIKTKWGVGYYFRKERL